MAEYRTYECRECLTPQQSRRPNQVVCPMCRIIGQLEFWTETKTKTRKCQLCSEPFLQLNRSDRVCGDCTVTPKARRGGCVVCGHEDMPLYWHESVPMCKWCALDPNPGIRTRAAHALREVQGYTKEKRPLPQAVIAKKAEQKAEHKWSMIKSQYTDEEIQAEKINIPGYFKLKKDSERYDLLYDHFMYNVPARITQST